MSALQPVRGTRDILADEIRRHRRVGRLAELITERFGYGEIATPIFEFTEVFARTLGDTSDIVTKEMYTFEDRGGDRVTLRPEGTAGVVRALITNGLTQTLPLRLFYNGPMFRYERPQKGRYRQFHQIGIELIGASEPDADVEVIAVGAGVLEALGVLERTVLEINTLGDSASRATYRGVLAAYFSDHHATLSDDSRRRLERNPLRILDSKDAGDRKIVAGAPPFRDHLNAQSADFFARVLSGLDELGIAYTLNQRLVRGLDYYCHTAFEFTTEALGAQGTVLGGGRYDGLIALMGGPETPGIGWAAGIERLAMLLQETPEQTRPLALVPLGEAGERRARLLAHELRQAGLRVDLAFTGNMRRRLARADRIGASAALILGENELAAGHITYRDMASGAQRSLALDGLAATLIGMGQ
ncbi:MAG: histidine--tRNA ligase [Alphaproteobacteria bacterium]|nr:histidine--tRNA ligase [Alphaproteobacteria bacterium]